MPPQFKIFDADQVTVNFLGIDLDSGFDDGDFCMVEQAEDDFTSKTGTDGSVTRSKTNNRFTVVKVILMQTSDGNAKLSAVNNLDRLLPNGAGVGPMMVRDRQGTSIFAGANAWIAKPPDIVYGREASAREWTFHVARPSRFDGGN